MEKFLILFFVFILTGCSSGAYVSPTEEGEIVERETIPFYSTQSLENLSDKKECWGMRRNPPNRPEFTQEQKEKMDKYGCIYMGSNEGKYLYLTFDEGYENGQSARILDVLKEKGVTATFFITGDYLKKEGDLVDRMVLEGHNVGNHTMNHPCVAEIKNIEKLEEEILSLDRAFYGKYKKHMKYFRPPEGAYSEKSLAVTESLGYKSVFWSFAYDDWYTDKQRGKTYAYQKTMDNLHPGCVLLLHAVSKDNADALGDIIDSARMAGYTFLSLDEYIR
ncbi:MAG: polysaccharide deacetylase family protein [Clostridia bacterium]